MPQHCTNNKIDYNMKTFEIHCIIYDKLDPSNESNQVVSIELFTTILAINYQEAIQTLENLYKIQEILSIQEIL